jgi:hypothetical protein
MVSIFGGLLELKDENQLTGLADNLDTKMAVKLLEFALENCTDKFTLFENHLIYKCLETIKYENKTSNLRNDDPNGDSN